jgi:hypothetical protein
LKIFSTVIPVLAKCSGIGSPRYIIQHLNI